MWLCIIYCYIIHLPWFPYSMVKSQDLHLTKSLGWNHTLVMTGDRSEYCVLGLTTEHYHHITKQITADVLFVWWPKYIIFPFDEPVANPGGVRVLYAKYNLIAYPPNIFYRNSWVWAMEVPHPFQNTNVNTISAALYQYRASKDFLRFLEYLSVNHKTHDADVCDTFLSLIKFSDSRLWQELATNVLLLPIPSSAYWPIN